MKELELLQKQIEKCRMEMVELTKTHSFTSDIVVKMSQHLDDLLNQHQKMLKIGG